MDEWHFFKKKCKTCGSRKTKKILSAFSSNVQRTYTETLNELKQMGNVRLAPKQTPPWGEGPPAGGCPYENASTEENEEKPSQPAHLKPDVK